MNRRWIFLLAVVAAAAAAVIFRRASAREPEAIVTGRVVDERRFPVEGARVLLRSELEPAIATRSDSDGRFEFDVVGRGESIGKSLVVFARGPSGGVAFASVWLAARDHPSVRRHERRGAAERLDAGPLALWPSHSLDVRVARGGAPVAGARVAVECAPLRGAIDERTTDARGVASFDALPAGVVYLRAHTDDATGRGRAYLPDEREASIELRADARCVIEVVDIEKKVPVRNASIFVTERWSAGASNESGTGQHESRPSRRIRPEPWVTGVDGRAIVAGIPAGAEIELSVLAAGYYEPWGNECEVPPLDGDTPDAPRVVRVEVGRIGFTTYRWPIVDGEVPAPADGSAIRLRDIRYPRSFDGETERPDAYVEGSALVVERMCESDAFLAEAPDGSLARLHSPFSDGEGSPFSFRLPRKIEVTVRARNGAPVEGAKVRAHELNHEWESEWIDTDRDGRAVLTGLCGDKAEVEVAPPRSSFGYQRKPAYVDLSAGDARVEASLTGSIGARVVLRIDGVPALPARYWVYPTPHDERPDVGELRVALPRSPMRRDDDPEALHVRALGFRSVEVPVVPSSDGSETLVTIDLERTPDLFVRVHRPPDQPVAIGAERWNAEQSRWEHDSKLGPFWRLTIPNGPGGSFLIRGSNAGRWRAIDRESGVCSAPFEVAADTRRVNVDLDVPPEQWVSGRVEVPPGSDPSETVVVVDQIDPPARPPAQPLHPPAGAKVGPDGTFRVRIPGDREVTLRPWHLWLVADPERVVTTTLGRDGIELRLVEGTEVRVLLPGYGSVAVAAYRGPIAAEPDVWMQVARHTRSGTARFGIEPGRWTFWINAGHDVAPFVFEDVEVRAGVNVLPEPEPSNGSTLRVRVRVPPCPWRQSVDVSARSLDQPTYYRSVQSWKGYPHCTWSPTYDEAEFLLRGFGAGRFSVRANVNGDGSEDREVNLDGRSEVVLDFDLR